MKRFFPFLIIFLVICVFFQAFILHYKLPIPSDTLVGLYHPFRDLLASAYPRGLPFKNFLITDPVRQEYVWRFLSYQIERGGFLPIWNPYNGLGMPLLANQQSAVLYPFNILFFFFPFAFSWSMQIALSLILGSYFLYLYLRQLKISLFASVFGAITFAFCGFTTAWLEWNTVMQSLIWLPFVLWSIEKLFASQSGYKKNMYTIFASFGLVMSLFAGHLQTFFYVSMVSFGYFLLKLFIEKKYWKQFFLFIALVFLISLVQLLPTFQLVSLSARTVDLDWHKDGWFIPLQHLLQFFIPDFFGNPTTLNYWGVWNYAEMVGYIGIIPLIFSLIGGLFVKRNVIYFFIFVLVISLIFAVANPIASLPFVFHIPFITTSQPTRLLSIIDFSLIVLAAFGIDAQKRISSKKLFIIIGSIGALFASIWIFLLFGNQLLHIVGPENVLIAKRNSVLPTGLFILGSFFLLCASYCNKQKIVIASMTMLLLLTLYDGMRFSQKFNPFTSSQLLYPSTSAIVFLQNHLGDYRYMTTDDSILPPNTGAYFHLQSLDVYDPLYLERYGEFIAAVERGKANINPPFGFNRIISPHSYNNPFINLLGVKYVVSLDSITSVGLKEVFSEGQTKIYENLQAFPRAFFVKEIISVSTKQQGIESVFQEKDKLSERAVVEGIGKVVPVSMGFSVLKKETANEVVIETENSGDGFLVLSDAYYPTWHAYIDGEETKIYPTDFVLRGAFVPKGKHTIAFKVGVL